MTRDESIVSVDGRELTLTNLGKIMYPSTGTTKGDVVAYYADIAPFLVAHARWRPATRKRWVHGVGTAEHPGQVFFQKNLEPSAPTWVKRFTLSHSDGETDYPLVNDRPTLVWLAQLAALEIHVPQWQFGPRGRRKNPDRLVLDLDPGEGAGLAECVEVAMAARRLLLDLGFDAIPVTSGSKGIHLYAGLGGQRTSEQISSLAHDIARQLESQLPALVVSDMRKALRAGKVLVDWSQNNGAKTTVAPYSLRGTTTPTVASPRRWRELNAKGLRQLTYDEVLRRVKKSGDPLAALSTAQPQGGELLNRLPPAARMPIEPMLATPGLANDVGGADWSMEMKWDGVRAICQVGAGASRLWSRTGKELTATFPELATALSAACPADAVLDGEIVALDESGRPDFGRLQSRLGITSPAKITSRSSRVPVSLMLFDILALDGRSTTRLPYVERRELLTATVQPSSAVVVPPAFTGQVDQALRTSVQYGLEGVVAKRSDGPYRPGRRSSDWVKIKHARTQEVVVAGWRPGNGRRARTVGSLLLGVRDEAGDLQYVGRVGTGFSDRDLEDMRKAFSSIARKTPTLVNVPADVARDARWLRPTLVGEVQFTEWTADGHLRHPTWRGWRGDKQATTVVREP